MTKIGRLPAKGAKLTTLTVAVCLPLRALSPNVRSHWAVKADAVQKYRLHCGLAAMYAIGSNDKPHWAEATVQIKWYRQSARKIDRDNALASLKPCFDALQDAGVIDNDNGLTFAPVVFELDRERPRVELIITPTPNSER